MSIPTPQIAGQNLNWPGDMQVQKPEFAAMEKRLAGAKRNKKMKPPAPRLRAKADFSNMAVK